jgi:hypothetical protein
MIHQDDLDLIHKFLEKSLSEEEVPLFKEKLSRDPEFRREVNAYTGILIALKAGVRTRDKIIGQKKSLFVPVILFMQARKKMLVTGGIAILVIVCIGIVYQQLHKNSNGAIYATFYRTPPGYLAGQYKGLPAPSGETMNSDPEKLFYAGIHNMEQENFHEAARLFELLLHNPDNLYASDGEWFLSLCYLKQDEMNKAILLLEKITAANNIHTRDAADILKRLPRKN